MSSPYSSYKGQSIGRVIHAFWIYNQGYNSINPDEIQVDDGEVFYHGKLIATYYWVDSTPVFTFLDYIGSENYKSRLTRSQYIRLPFLDDPFMLMHLGFCVQEIRRAITLEDALWLMWVRDKHNSNGDSISLNLSVEKKIKDRLREVYYGEGGPEQHWRHIGLCAVYGLTNSET